MSVSVVIATYGHEVWKTMARTAAESVVGAKQVILSHDTTLATARNSGAQQATGDRLVFLDADDELAPDFISRVVETEDILQPKTIYRDENSTSDAFWIAPRENLLMGNHIVIGAPVNRRLFLASGGFDEYPIAEDWALWLKMKKLGVTFGRTEATYIVNVNHTGRNTKSDAGVYEQIRTRFS